MTHHILHLLPVVICLSHRDLIVRTDRDLDGRSSSAHAWLKCLNACAKVIHTSHLTTHHHNSTHMVAERGSREHISERIAKQIVDASLGDPVEEWSLLPLVYKNAVDSRRAAWRVITSIEQNEKPEGKEQLASHAREYIAEVEGELQKIRDGVLALMDKNLIPSASTDESKVLYCKMKSDYYRYLAECATDDAKGKATEDTCAAYAEATKIAKKDLVVNHLVRLAMDTKRSLKTRCSETNEEFDRRVVDRQTELKAVIDAICTLNSDTSFDTYTRQSALISFRCRRWQVNRPCGIVLCLFFVMR